MRTRSLPHVLLLLTTCALAFCQVLPPLAAEEIAPEVAAAERARIDVIRQVAPSVVAIFPPSGKGGGSGVLIEENGLALSNFHVVSGAGPFLKCGLNDGQVYDAVLIGIDPTGDVALIQLLGRDSFPHAPLGDSDEVQAGDWAMAMGNPFLLAEDFTPTVTYGMVSGVRRYQYPAGTFLEYTDCIQVDASINPGNSGGPLFNLQGELIGINGRGSFEKRGRVHVGAGYAISINQIKHFLDHLHSGRIVDHASLGAVVATDPEGTVIVDSILEQSDAYRRGLRVGDEIVRFGDRAIGSVNQFKNVLGIYPNGWRIPLVYRRDGERRTIYVRLEALHTTAELLEFSQKSPGVPEEGPDKPEKPRLPIPLPHQQKEPEIPAEYKDLYVERSGYANYHFNLQRQELLTEAVGALGNWGAADQKWTFQGQTRSAEFTLTLADFAALLKFPTLNQTYLLDPDREDSYSEPADSGGLLMALRQWRRLLIDGADGFDEFYYLGSEPLDGRGSLVHVLITSDSTIQCRWYFDRETSLLVGWDCQLAPDRDECRVRILEWKQQDSRQFPSRLVISQAENVFAELSLDQLTIEKIE